VAGKRDDIDLMLYHDGELSPEAAADVVAQLEAGSQARAKLEGLGEIREGVRTYLELEADRAEPALDGMWDRVERQLSANGRSTAKPEAAMTEAGAEPMRASAGAEPPAIGILGAIWRWFDEHRGNIITGAVTAGAVAAIFLVYRPTRETVVERVVHAPAPVEATPAALGAPATVDYLNVVDGTGTVLTIPGEDDEDTTTVLWVEPDEDSVEGPI